MKRIAIATLAAALAGCAVAPQVQQNYSYIDPQGVDMDLYAKDYAECSGLALQTNPVDRAAGGAAFGALFGAVLGAVLCGRACVGAGAAGGALGGSTGAAASGVREQQGALRACLAGRGYRVIR